MRAGLLMTLVASWYLVGLSMTVAFVVYPSFPLAAGGRWVDFHQQHSRRITWAVGPAWVAQALGLALWLMGHPGATLAAWATCAGSALIAVVLTIAVAVPAHQRLSSGFDEASWRRLSRSHWLRSVAWVLAAGAATVATVQVA